MNRFPTIILITVAFATLITTTNAQLPMMNITGFAWAENMLFMPNGLELFASDAITGNIYKITLNENDYYETTLWVSSFSGACGFALPFPNDVNTNMFYVGATDKKTKQAGIYVLNSEIAGSVEVLGYTEYQGNGVAIHYESNTLFFTNEGSDLPTHGWIYAMNSVYQEGVIYNSTIVQDVYSADGCEIDQANNLLYVSSVDEGIVNIFNINPSTGELSFKNKYKAPTVWLDDFTLTSDGNTIFGADYFNKTVVSFDALTGANKVIQFETPFSPTSVRFGVSPNFNSTSFYVSLGGGLTKFVDDRGIIQGPSVL